MYRGLGGADLGSNWVYPRCTTAPVHHLIPNKQMGSKAVKLVHLGVCGRRTVKRPQAGKEVKEEAVVPLLTLTLTSTSTTLVSTLTPRRKERIKGMKQRDKVMLTGKKRFSSCMRRDRLLLDKPNVSGRNVIRREFSISFKISFSSFSKRNLSEAPNIPFHHGAIQELWVWVAALIPGNGPTYQIISCSTQSTPRPVPWWHSALQSGVVVVVVA